MSGGHYDYQYQRLYYLADEIDGEFVNDGIYKDTDYDHKPGQHPAPEKEYDRLGNATPEERVLILAEIRALIADLKSCGARAKELEWYMSGNTGPTTYLERIKQ